MERENDERRESIITKKATKILPENFFETVMDLDLKLKREFTMATLQELVNLYSIAIEYYESIEDQKYKDYQNRLNILLSQPEILKNMNEFHLQKGLPVNHDNAQNLAKKFQKEKEKKHIKMKVEYMTQISNFTNSNDKVQKIMETLTNTENTEEKEAKVVVNDELSKQKDNFQARLEEKRKRQSIYNSSFDKIDVSRDRRYSYLGISGISLNHLKEEGMNGGMYGSIKESCEENNFERDENEVLTSARTKKTERTEKTEKTSRTDKTKSNNENNEENYEINLENSFEKFEKGKIGEIDDMFSPFVNLENGAIMNGGASNYQFSSNNSKEIKNGRDLSTSTMTTMFKLNENLMDSKHIGPKHKQILFDIKQTLDQFVNEFNFYFYEYVFQRFTENIQKLMDEKYNKYIEISKNYHGQIKEMEFLLTDDSEDQHKAGIQAIIDSLKEEKDHELDRIDDHYNKLIADCQANFKNTGFKSNPGIQLVEEKLKLDMYNLINMILIPKKI